jgi:hypothetical protein
MSDEIDVDRSRLIQSAALTVAATQLCGSARGYAQPTPSKARARFDEPRCRVTDLVNPAFRRACQS